MPNVVNMSRKEWNDYLKYRSNQLKKVATKSYLEVCGVKNKKLRRS